jgi:hypothetical protein
MSYTVTVSNTSFNVTSLTIPDRYQVLLARKVLLVQPALKDRLVILELMVLKVHKAVKVL